MNWAAAQRHMLKIERNRQVADLLAAGLKPIEVRRRLNIPGSVEIAQRARAHEAHEQQRREMRCLMCRAIWVERAGAWLREQMPLRPGLRRPIKAMR